MDIYIDAATKVENSPEVMTFLKNNNIRYGLNEETKQQEDIEYIISNFDVIVTSDDSLMMKIKKRSKNVVIRYYDELTIELLKNIKNDTHKYVRGKSYHLKIICKLVRI